MACSKDISDETMDQQPLPGRDLSLPLQRDNSSSILHPDSERTVISQTVDVVSSFICELLGRDRSRLSADDLPSPDELRDPYTGNIDSEVFYDEGVPQIPENEDVGVLRGDSHGISRSRSSPLVYDLGKSSRSTARGDTNITRVEGQRNAGQSVSASSQNAAAFSIGQINTAGDNVGLPFAVGRDSSARHSGSRLHSGTQYIHQQAELNRRQAFSESESTQQLSSVRRLNQNQDLSSGSQWMNWRRQSDSSSIRNSRGSGRRSEEEEVDGGEGGVSMEEVVGRRLALIGDEVNDRYSTDFSEMLRLLKLTPSTAYEGFAVVARQLFRDGVISWGRIVVLLCFGYRLVVTVAERGVAGLFSKLVSFVVSFIVQERISRWIAAQGGWRAALRYIPEYAGWPTIGVVCAVAAVSVAAVFYLSNR